MGYSAFIIAKDEHLQKMFYFLKDNMFKNNSFGLRFGKNGFDGHSGISYSGGKSNPLMLGFDFTSSGGFEGEHMYSIIKWMAKTIGKNPNIYYYDGEESNIEKESIMETLEKEVEIFYEAHKGKLSKEDIFKSVCFMRFNLIPEDEKNLKKSVDNKIKKIENDINKLDKLWHEQNI